MEKLSPGVRRAVRLMAEQDTRLYRRGSAWRTVRGNRVSDMTVGAMVARFLVEVVSDTEVKLLWRACADA